MIILKLTGFWIGGWKTDIDTAGGSQTLPPSAVGTNSLGTHCSSNKLWDL